MTKQTFKIVVKSPYGTQPIEQWDHWIRKVADEADTRWGISISIERKTETEHNTEFE